MILDLDQFIRQERPFWDELQTLMTRQDNQPDRRMELGEIQRFHYLYQRASSDLVKMKTFAGDVEVRSWLENVVSRAYSQLHERRARSLPFRPWDWLLVKFPRTFRRHWRAFGISFGTFWLGAAVGAAIMFFSPDLKRELIPAQFSHVYQSPTERVEKEESQEFDDFEGRQQFSAMLMANNTKVTIFAMVLGITFGVMTIVVLFGNGILVGIICFDYIADGQGVFLTGWLLPHGSWELPAIGLGGQAGLILARALFGWGTNLRLRQRLRRIRPDLLTLVGGAAVMLVWAGIIESFLSQYHGPTVYPWKIGFGIVNLLILIAWLGFCGRRKKTTEPGAIGVPAVST